MLQDAKTIDIVNFIDEQPVGATQIRLLLLCAAVLFVDGFDTQAIGYVAPALVRDLHLPPATLGPVFSAGLFGLMIGALIFGPVADRIGRKKIIVASTVTFGLFTLATSLASDSTTLLVLRFLTGLGLGGAMPNAIALTSEFSPHRRRATMVMVMFCGFSVGAALGGLIAAALIPVWGWRAIFVVGGIIPLVGAPFLALRLPESVRFLALSKGQDARVRSLLTAFFPMHAFAADTHFVVPEAALAGVPVRHLFQENRTTVTLLLWVVFFMSLLDLYFLANWLPTIVSGLGVSDSVAVLVAVTLQIGGVVGVLTLGRLVDRFSYNALALTFFVAALAVAAIGWSAHSLAFASLAIFCAGFCIVGGQTAANALTATFYPTGLRSTGVGWALGIGRIGSIIGPLIGGELLRQHWSSQSLFLTAAVPALFATLAAFGLSHVARR